MIFFSQTNKLPVDALVAMRIVAKVDLYVHRGESVKPHVPENYIEKLRDFTSGLRKFR